MTAQEVATGAGIDQGHYSRIENGGKCSAGYAEKISRFFASHDVQISELEILYPARFCLPKNKVGQRSLKKYPKRLEARRGR